MTYRKSNPQDMSAEGFFNSIKIGKTFFGITNLPYNINYLPKDQNQQHFVWDNWNKPNAKN